MEVEKVALVAVTANAAEKVTVKTGGKIKAAAGTKYLLQVINSDVSPENATVQRDGKDLQVFFEGSDKPDLTIQDFFAEGMDSQLYGVAEDGQLYAYVRTDGEGYYGPLLLNEGESAPIALGGDSLGDGAPYLASNFDETAGFVLWPWLLGLAGIGAATAAIIEHNRPDDHKTRTSPAPTNIKVIDDVGPIQGQLANGDVTDDARPTVTGSGMAGAVIRLYDNGTEIGSTQVGADGTWSFTPTADLPDGEHKFTVIQEVSGRKPSAPVDVLDFSVDTVPPADPVATIVGGVENGGDLYSPSNTPTLTGTGEPGDTIIIEFPTGEKVTTTVGPDGKWTANPPSQGLPEGPVDIIITERDPAGNETTVKLPAIVDTIAPDAPQVWLDPASDSGVKGDNITNDTKPKIVGKAEANSQVTVTIKETGEVIQVKADQNGDWSVMPTRVLPEGPIHIEAVATDAAGNTSQPGTLDLTIDTTPPNYHDLAITGVLDSVGEITGNIANGGETDDAHPVISGTGTRGEGKVIPSSREQVIQSLEGGILEQMNVREGDVVEAGQVLLKIDPTRAGASFRETESKVLALKGQLARLRSEAYGKPLSFPPDVQAVQRAAYARANAAEEKMESTRRESEYLIRNLVEQRDLSASRVDDYKSLLVESDRVRKMFYDQWYHLGKRTLLDVLIAENEYYSAQIAACDTYYNAKASDLRIRAETSGLMAWLAPGSEASAR
ncbi:Ig-like domain-containing protein [Pseudomonas sp. GCEP-101]|uniref:Ig-like domain-containing protein n=1 Tax=Pseudomonas sp. GCEP-101 TaxID=2974552 RepID=UPI003FA74034